MSSFPLGGTPPDRFFHALGRLSFEAEAVSASLNILLQVLTKFQSRSILSLLFDGEPIVRKIAICKRLLKEPNIFEERDVSELNRILEGISGLFKERNKYIHSSWDYYNENLKKACATWSKRSGAEEVIVSIEENRGTG